MTVRNLPFGAIARYIGASSDTKPTVVSHTGLAEPDVNSTFFEYDTGILYITYDGTNWVVKDDSSGSGIGRTLKTVSVTKVLATADETDAEDVLSESASNGVGTAWTFSSIGRVNGGTGLILKAIVISETTAKAPRLTLFLFNAAPTCELDDDAANTAVLHADLAKYVGKIDFPAMEDLGTGDSEAIAVPGQYPGGLPLAFECATAADDLYGVLVTRDAVTFDAGDDMTIILTAIQF